MPQASRSNFYQILVFLLIFALIIGGLIVGSGRNGRVPTALADKETAAERTGALITPHIYFVEPIDQAVVPTTFTVQMGAEGLTVEPSGEVHEGAGHFHILIDVPFVEPGEAIPADEQHVHFGKAQLSAELTLPPGEHVLRLQFANGEHIALEGDQYHDEITVTVE